MPEIMRMRADGMRWQQIATHFNVSPTSLHAHVVNYTSRMHMRLDQLAQDIETWEEIAHATGRAVSMVIEIVTRGGY